MWDASQTAPWAMGCAAAADAGQAPPKRPWSCCTWAPGQRVSARARAECPHIHVKPLTTPLQGSDLLYQFARTAGNAAADETLRVLCLHSSLPGVHACMRSVPWILRPEPVSVTCILLRRACAASTGCKLRAPNVPCAAVLVSALAKVGMQSSHARACMHAAVREVTVRTHAMGSRVPARKRLAAGTAFRHAYGHRRDCPVFANAATVE